MPELQLGTNVLFKGKHDWLEKISRGGLKRPTPKFSSQVKKMEELFQNFHGKSVVYSDPINGFFSLLQECLAMKLP